MNNISDNEDDDVENIKVIKSRVSKQKDSEKNNRYREKFPER